MNGLRPWLSGPWFPHRDITPRLGHGPPQEPDATADLAGARGLWLHVDAVPQNLKEPDATAG